MYCLVFLLCIGSIPKVLLKPTVANSEVSDTSKDEETRFKRQAAFFQLLHQAIEKYADSADVQLAPLKALANYKQYETFAYPDRSSQPSAPIVRTLHPSHHHNSAHLKCKKINLCSPQNQHPPPPDGSNSQHTADAEADAAKQKPIPYFLSNTKHKIYMPISVLNHYAIGNMPATFITNSGSKNNNTHFAPSQTFINGVLYGPTDYSTKKPLTSSSTQSNNCTCSQDNIKETTKKPTTVQSSASSTQSNNCTCSPDNIKETTKKPTTVQYSTSSTQSKNCTCSQDNIKETTKKPTTVQSSASSTQSKNCTCPQDNIKETTKKPTTVQSSASSTQSKNCTCPQDNIKETTKKPTTVQSSASSTQSKNCTCPQDNIKETTKKPTTVQSSASSTQSINCTCSQNKTKYCPCPKETEKEIAANNTATTNSSSETKLSFQESPRWHRNLTLLFLQLDEMAQKVDNEELKEILETLKTFKTAFEFNSTNNECINTHVPTTTTRPPAKKSIFTIIKELLFGRKRQVNPKSENVSTHNSQSTNSSDKHTSTQVTSDSSLQPTKSTTALPDITTISVLNESGVVENPADWKSAFLHLNDSSIKHSIEAVTNSTVFRTNLANHQDLMRIRDILTSRLSHSHQGTQTDYEPTDAETKAVRTQVVAGKNKPPDNSNEETSLNNTLLDNLDLFAANLGKNLDLVSPINNRNDTKITISITSNGNFKNIQVEQTIGDKNLEINEKENMNMATSNTQARPADMMGTGSRHVNILKQPERKGPYAEPILSETYSDSARFRTKAPLSIYWNKVEEKPLKFKRIPSDVFKSLRSDDVDGNEIARRSNEEYLSNMLEKGIDFANIPYTEESDSWSLT